MDLYRIWIDAGGDGTREGFLEHLKSMWPEKAADIDANPLRYLKYYGFRATPGGLPEAGGGGLWPEGDFELDPEKWGPGRTDTSGATATAAAGEGVGVGSLFSGGLGGGGRYGAEMPAGVTAEELRLTNPAEYFSRYDPGSYGLRELEGAGYSYGPYAAFLRNQMVPEAAGQLRLAQMLAAAQGGEAPSLDVMRRAMGGARYGSPGDIEDIMANPAGMRYMQQPESAAHAADVYGAYRASKPAAYGPFADYMNRQSSLDWRRYMAQQVGQPEMAWLDYIRSRGY